MGTITRAKNGSVVAVYDRSRLQGVDDDVLRYAVSSFYHLLPRGKRLSFVQFAELINNHYLPEGKVEICLKVLDKASVLKRFVCSFTAENESHTRQAAVHAISWSEVKREVERHMGCTVSNLTFRGVSEKCVLGRLTFEPAIASAEVVS